MRQRTFDQGTANRWCQTTVVSTVSDFFLGPVTRSRTKLSGDVPAGASHHPHVNAGHRHMSNTDTLVSVIVGVCQQDPERWRQFDAIYRPMLGLPAEARPEGVRGQ